MNEYIKAFEKINNTLCLNNNEGTLQFDLSEQEHLDCKDTMELVDCLALVSDKLYTISKIEKAWNLVCELCVNLNSVIGIVEWSCDNYTLEEQVKLYNSRLFHGMGELTVEDWKVLLEVLPKNEQEI